MPGGPARHEERLPVGALGRACLVVLVLAAAGCGGDEDGGGSGDPAPGVELTITVTREGETREATLECDPNGGSHPDPDEACRALAQNVGSLDPVPGDVACTQIYGGPERARMVGTVSGRPVDATLNRTNGCEIARWDHLERVLDLADDQG